MTGRERTGQHRMQTEADAGATHDAGHDAARWTASGEDTDVPRSRRYLLWLALLPLAFPVSDVVRTATPAVTTPAAVTSLAAVAAVGLCFLRIAVAVTGRAWPDGPPRDVQWCTTVLAVVALVTPLLRRDVEWTSFDMYATVGLTFVLPLQQTGRVVLSGAVVTAAQSAARGSGLRETVTAALLVAGVGTTTMGLRRSRMLVRRLRAAQGEVARLAAVEERLRISRDLHDLLGHSLSLIAVKSELAGRLAAAAPHAAAKEIGDVESVARKALTEVRDAVTGYRQLSLAEEIDDARAALAAGGVDMVVRHAPEELPEPVGRLLGWAVREGCTNVLRHAGASRCTLTVRVADGTAVLEISDDGRGPEPEQEPGGAGGDGRDGAHGGNGLAGLTERAAEAGGTLTTAPATRSGRGFRLTLGVPLATG